MIEIPAGPAWLFCPSDRPERFAKAAAAADAAILDLEDGVAALQRESARRNLRRAADELDPARTIVRINPVGTDDHIADLEAIASTPFRLLMLAKTESAQQLESLAGFSVVALCETAAGILRAPSIAASSGCSAMMWGAEDLIAGLGGTSSRDADGRYRSVAVQARSIALLSAGAADIPALDAVYLDINDLKGLFVEASDAAESGFNAKVCIHPSQVPLVRQAFLPSADQVTKARRIVNAAEAAPADGVFSLDGQMVDEPLVRQARRTLARFKPNI